jgi:hypothetical protein
MQNLHVAEVENSSLRISDVHQCSLLGKRTWRNPQHNVEGTQTPARHILQSLKAVVIWRSPFIAALTIGGIFQAVSGVGISGQITFGRLGMSAHITVGCAPRACTPDRIHAIVCSSTRIAAAVQSIDSRENQHVLARLHDRATIEHIVDRDCGVRRHVSDGHWHSSRDCWRYVARSLPVVAPPSRTSVAPVMYRPAFDARKATISATSLGLPW